jgi:hypothetical protein
MEPLGCPNCQGTNPSGARFCNRCGQRLADNYIEPDLESRILENVRSRLKDDYLSKDLVEKDVALRIATRVSDWAKIFGLAAGIPLAIFAAILGFFSVKGIEEFAALDAKAKTLAKTGTSLQGDYNDLQAQLPGLKSIARDIQGLKQQMTDIDLQTKSALSDYAVYLTTLGFKAHYPIPLVRVLDQLPRPGYHSYLLDDEIFVLRPYAKPANVLHEYSHAVLFSPATSYADDQWVYSAIEAGLANYLTASFLRNPKLDQIDLGQTYLFLDTPHTFTGGQSEGGMAWGSVLWALRKASGDKTDAAVAQGWRSVAQTSPPSDYSRGFANALISAGVDAAAVKRAAEASGIKIN